MTKLIIKTTADILNYINRFASKEQTSHAINCVHIEHGDVVATDGHRLGVWHRAVTDAEWNPGASGLSAPTDAGFSLMTKDKTVEQVLRKMRGEVTIVIEDYNPESYDNYAVISDAAGLCVRVAVSGDTYPDYKKVIPDYSAVSARLDGPFEIGFNPRYLADFGGFEKGDGLRLVMYDAMSPALVYNTKLPDFVGVLMPMRV